MTMPVHMKLVRPMKMIQNLRMQLMRETRVPTQMTRGRIMMIVMQVTRPQTTM